LEESEIETGQTFCHAESGGEDDELNGQEACVIHFHVS
jgi:hypothetical protein